MTWTRALHFKTWADTQQARHTLPLLLRRLVRATVNSDSLVNFPAMEQVQRPGLDGIVETNSDNQFVPKGKSVWEMGVSSDKKSKADDDFEKRTKEIEESVQRETTFVFVTPREWRKKDEWAEEKKSDSQWKDVVVLDANDLEHWIELCPAVDVWFSTASGRRPEGIVDLGSKWLAISGIAKHPLSPKVLLASREETTESLKNWLQQSPSSALLKCDSAADGIDYLSALIADEAEDSRLERMFVVDDLSTWQKLWINREPIILVASVALPLSADDVGQAVSSGHHVLIAGRQSSSPSAGEIHLQRQISHEVEKQLEGCGFDEAEARSFSLAACGSSSILKRLIATHPQSLRPEWSEDSHRTELAAFALLGGWVHVDPEPRDDGPLPIHVPIDLMCIEDFIGIDRTALEAAVDRWGGTDEPLFLRFQDHIVVASREDSWYLLGGSITPTLLKRFEDLASLVLEEDNPALELEEEKRWMANIYGKSHSLSGELREAILESLVMMSVYPVDQRSTPTDFKGTVQRVLDQALPIGSDWKRWATFDRQLPLLAEADPDFLLARIEKDLVSDQPALPALFEATDGGMFSSSYHCGLLWALEKMAWSPQYLPRVTAILAKLVEVEQRLPNNIGNRPSSSLNKIYLWWIPHTNATVEERITQLRRIIQSHPDVGWSLLVGMLPSGHATCDPSVKPRWRDWAIGWSRARVRSETPGYATQIAELVLDAAGASPERWAQLLDGVFRYSTEISQSAVKRLEAIAGDSSGVTGRDELWKSLRQMIHQHEKFEDADWSFDDSLLEPLRAILQQLQPADPVLLHEWLFEYHPDLEDIDTSDGYEDYHVELNALRSSALREVIEDGGWDAVTRLIGEAADVHSLGFIVGREQLLNHQDFDFWILVESEDQKLRQFLSAFVAGSFQAFEFEFVQQLELTEQQPSQVAKVCSCLPFERRVWDWIDSNLKSSCQRQYWKFCRGLVRNNDSEDLSFAIHRLLEVDRPFTAADILQMAMRDIDLDLEQTLHVLESGLSSEKNSEPIEKLDTYATQELIGFLQENYTDDLGRLARIEYGFLPVLDRHSSRVAPLTLFGQLANSPGLFVDFIKLVFRGANEEPREEPFSEFEQRQAQRAYELLEEFSTVPGTTDDGEVDGQVLRAWVTEVRRLATDADRISVTDQQIGRLLSHYPKGEEQWLPDSLYQVLEEVGSDEVLRGFINGIHSDRGATSRSPFCGGEQERELAAEFRGIAESIQVQFPRVSQAILHHAEYYDHAAAREDEEAERRKLGR